MPVGPLEFFTANDTIRDQELLAISRFAVYEALSLPGSSADASAQDDLLPSAED